MTTQTLAAHADAIGLHADAFAAFVATLPDDHRPLDEGEVERARRLLLDLKRHVETALVDLYPLTPAPDRR